LYVNAVGLTTSVMPYGDRGVEIVFDFHRHALDIVTSDGDRRELQLRPRTVADFHDELFARLAELHIDVKINGRPNEVAVAIPFAQDTVHASYDPVYAHRFWLSLMHADRVLTAFRSRFIGKASPVHLWWGGLDIAVTRFSGRRAPRHPGGVPNCPAWVMELAYSHEVSSCGYWPGALSEGAFYSYAYPPPPGFHEQAVRPDAAFFDDTYGEYLLPYDVVRTAADPDAVVLEFLQSTYEAAADLAAWDRAALEA
jgi:hypothetical protein